MSCKNAVVSITLQLLILLFFTSSSLVHITFKFQEWKPNSARALLSSTGSFCQFHFCNIRVVSAHCRAALHFCFWQKTKLQKRASLRLQQRLKPSAMQTLRIESFSPCWKLSTPKIFLERFLIFATVTSIETTSWQVALVGFKMQNHSRFVQCDLAVRSLRKEIETRWQHQNRAAFQSSHTHTQFFKTMLYLSSHSQLPTTANAAAWVTANVIFISQRLVYRCFAGITASESLGEFLQGNATVKKNLIPALHMFKLLHAHPKPRKVCNPKVKWFVLPACAKAYLSLPADTSASLLTKRVENQSGLNVTGVGKASLLVFFSKWFLCWGVPTVSDMAFFWAS